MIRALLSSNGLDLNWPRFEPQWVRQEAVDPLEIVILDVFCVLYGPLLLLFFQLISDRFKFNGF